MVLASGSALGWHPHVDVWLAVAGLAIGYVVGLRRLGPGEGATGRQKMFFVTGIVLLWLGADWPLHDIAERSLFSAHMLQHLIFTFVVPPLLLLGMPKALLRRILRPRWLFGLVRVLTRPIVALIAFNAVIAITHWPPIVDAAVTSTPAHLVLHWVLIGTAVMMWWSVVGPLPELPSLQEPARMFYLFMQSILPTVPASFLTFANAPIYKSYIGMDHLWGLSTLNDQRIAGLIMKLGGGLLLWAIITYLFFSWNAKEEGARPEEVSWEDFERELQAWDLRR